MPTLHTEPFRLVIFALAGCALALTGCVTDYQPGRATLEDSDQYPQVVIIGNLGGAVRKHKPLVTPSMDDAPMAVTVPLRLMSDKSREIQYRFTFFDAAGRPLGPEMDWRWKVMPARALIHLQGAALDDRAVDWRLELRPYKES